MAWRQWSRKAQALINIGAQLNQERFPRVADWRVVKDLADSGLGETEQHLRDMGLVEPDYKCFTRAPKNLDKAYRQLAYELDDWISIGQIRPRLSWKKRRAQDRIGPADGARFSLDAVTSGPNLFGLLALDLALAIAGKSLAVCTACAKSYMPKRRPNPNRQNYCEYCGLKAAQSHASRRYRMRKRAETE
jgi:hypothetical protein